ncbi:MAG: CBM96 family carbohydrate-binding protein [Pyrinomonadaceae bacterium]
MLQQISNYSPIGTGQYYSLSDNPTMFTWTDGTPGASATNVRTGIFTPGLGNGFQFTVPADTELKTLRVYLGLWSARGRFEASLSDASATTYIDTSLNNDTSTSNGIYTIAFSAASAGQTLTIKYTAHSTSVGNVTLASATLKLGGDPDAFPVVNMSSPVNGATFHTGDTLTLFANAFDPDGAITDVTFYVDGFVVGTGTPAGTNQYSCTWTTLFAAGTHTLTAVARDDLGAISTSEPINVTAISAPGGVLTGASHLRPSNPINLTNEGTLDWGHWGNGSQPTFDHKIGVPQPISNASIIGTSVVEVLADSFSPFSWSDGTPNATATNNVNGIFVSNAGNGFEITLPADTNFRTARLFAGAWYGEPRLELALSDGSAPILIDTSGGGNGIVNLTYAFTYRAASNGQLLRIRYTNTAQTISNIRLEGITLTSGGPPTVSLTSPANGAVFNGAQNIPLAATASDFGDSISKVEFFYGATKIGESTISPYTFTWTNPVSGALSLTAVATDNQGITATSAPVNIQVNAAPVVNAGPNRSVTLPAMASLYGSVSDDGLPNPPGTMTLTWTKTSGPGTVSFGTPNAAVTTASFSSEGDYVLRLTANDGALTSYSEATVTARAAATINLNATADAHVRDGSSAGTNFGTATTIETQSSTTTGQNRDAYFKFDLTNVGDVSNAKLRIFAATSAAGSITTSVHPVTNTTWSETTVNWNNRPTLGSPVIASTTVNGITFAWYELDVTNYVMGEKEAGRNLVTLALHNPSTSTIYIKTNSKEAASNKPQLVITTPETSFVKNKTLGTLRNNLTGWVGMKFTVSTTPVTVTSLGRIYVTGNTGTHTVKIVNAGTGADVAGASVSINMSAGTAVNGFKYGALAAPVTLSANTAYYLVSQETSGGDQWYDFNTVLTTATVATVNNAIQRPSNSWVAAGGANNSYVPVDFRYSAKTPAPTAIFHLHAEASSTAGLLKLDTAGPDLTPITPATSNLKGQPNGEYLISAFDTQALLAQPGYISAGSTVVFNIWMSRQGTAGTMFPRVKLNLNSGTGASICSATGTSSLTATITKYTLTCTVGTNVTTTATDKYYLWVGVNLTAGSSNKDFYAVLRIEGVLNGNYDSQITVPLPVAPAIYALSPTLSPTGTSVTINGANFGALQGSSSVSFNGQTASINSWSSTVIVATVPAGATTGPVVATVNGAASNGVVFTVGPADSDNDGLPDAWELQYFGNLGQGANGDPDGDGVTNIQEFRQGRDPTKGAIADPNGSVDLKLYPPVDP